MRPRPRETWRKGLAEWDQDGARIQRLRDAAEVAIYTPGSDAGRPLSVLRSFAAPAAELRADAGALRERIGATVAGLLGLVGIDADPIKSREHILLSTLFDQAWSAGRDLDLAGAHPERCRSRRSTRSACSISRRSIRRRSACSSRWRSTT